MKLTSNFFNRDHSETKVKERSGIIMDNPLLKKIKPQTGYIFYSDYFKIDSYFATYLTIYHAQGSDDNLPAMWAIALIPGNLGDGVICHLMTHVSTLSEKWIENHQSKADMYASNQEEEDLKKGHIKDKLISSKMHLAIIQISREILNGDSYMQASFKLFIKAPSMEKLDLAIDRLSRMYNDRFGKVYVSSFDGQQLDDFSRIMMSANRQLGKQTMFTSSEMAGTYNLVTQGIHDPQGVYVGQMQGDINSPAVLWDTDLFKNHAVVAFDGQAETLSEWFPGQVFKHVRGSSVWGLKIAQSALMDNHRVVHLVLNAQNHIKINNEEVPDIMGIGADLSDITTLISMDKGELNLFEMFGDPKDNFSIFSQQTEKLRLMTKQFDPKLSPEALNLLSDEIKNFYIDQGMWVENAKEFPERVKIVGIPHEQIPNIDIFYEYISNAFENVSSLHGISLDTADLRSLKSVYRRMRDEYGDLFNNESSYSLDKVNKTPQVIYDFSKLSQRGSDVLLAQFVNALGFATMSLKRGDVLIIHGCENLNDSILDYTKSVLDKLLFHDVRIVYLYNSIDRMLDQVNFNKFSSADYTLTGHMDSKLLNRFEDTRTIQMPADLRKVIATKDNKICYLRRDFNNLVFKADPMIGQDFPDRP